MNTEDNFGKFVFSSLLLHISLFLIYTVKAVLLPSESMVYEPAMRVDLIALPEKITQLTPPDPQPSKSEDQKIIEPQESVQKIKDMAKDDSIVLKNEKEKPTQKPESSIAKIKESMAIDKIKNMLNNKNNEAQDGEQKDSNSKKFEYKGNLLSPGTELTGLNKLQHESYQGDLDRHVKKFWMLPEWIAKKNYSAQIRIFIDEKGYLIQIKMIRSSGSKEYDETVVESVKKAMPFPAPPPKFKNIVAVSGVLLGFPE